MPAKLRRSIAACSAILIAITLAACSTEPEPNAQANDADQNDPQLRVVATVAMIADLAENIATDRANVTTLINAGVDPHLYAPTRTDIAAITSADLVLYNGYFLEGEMTNALTRAHEAGRTTVPVTERLPETMRLPAAGDDYEGAYDPHAWMDPLAWREAAIIIRDALIEADPEGKDHYTANADQYLESLDQLHEYAQRVLGTVPEGQRILITAHDAFGYFARRYGFQVIAVQGLSTASEANLRDIANLVQTIVNNNIDAIFVETTVSTQNIDAIIEGARERGQNVTIGGTLFSDAMGPTGTYEGTYLGMFDHNATTIARALGGQAPQRGMNERLTQQN